MIPYLGAAWSDTLWEESSPYFRSIRISLYQSLQLQLHRRNVLQVQIGCSQLSLLQDQTQHGRATGTRVGRSKESPFVNDASWACRSGESTNLPLLHSFTLWSPVQEPLREMLSIFPSSEQHSLSRGLSSAGQDHWDRWGEIHTVSHLRWCWLSLQFENKTVHCFNATQLNHCLSVYASLDGAHSKDPCWAHPTDFPAGLGFSGGFSSIWSSRLVHPPRLVL